jgi:hypothetical protein
VGNSSGNLLNGGLFCEYNNKVYFSNPNDGDSLYVMDQDATNYKKLHTDKVSYLNVAGKYIFYCRKNNEREQSSADFFLFNNTGVYRVNKDGTGFITLSPDPADIVSLGGNYVYYQHFDQEKGMYLYKIKLNGKEESLVLKEQISPHAIQDNTLYYTNINKNHNIKAMDLTTGASKTIYDGNSSSCIVTDRYIYYLSNTDNYAIGRVNLDGSNPTIIVNERCATFNLSTSGKYLYYQVDDGENNRICMMNVETKESKTILEGNFNHIHTTSNYVFFQKFNSNETYIMNTGSEANPTAFNPPIIED